MERIVRVFALAPALLRHARGLAATVVGGSAERLATSPGRGTPAGRRDGGAGSADSGGAGGAPSKPPPTDFRSNDAGAPRG